MQESKQEVTKIAKLADYLPSVSAPFKFAKMAFGTLQVQIRM